MFHKMTTISGRDLWFHLKVTTRPGTWQPQAIINLAKKMDIVGKINVTFSTGDTSGKGRSGVDKTTTLYTD